MLPSYFKLVRNRYVCMYVIRCLGRESDMRDKQILRITQESKILTTIAIFAA